MNEDKSTNSQKLNYDPLIFAEVHDDEVTMQFLLENLETFAARQGG